VAVLLIVLAAVAVLLFTLRARPDASSSQMAGDSALAGEIPEIEDLATLDPSLRAAIEEKVAAARRDPSDADACGELGRLYHAHGYYALARRSYQIAHGRAPRAAAWPYYLGVLASGRGQTSEAIDSLRQALALDPDYLPTYLRLGNVFLADGQLAAADGMYTTLVAKAPEDSWGYLGRGKVARRQGRLSEASELLERAVARAPDDREGTYLLAMTYRELGRPEVARQHLEGLDRRSRAWPPDPLMELIRTGRQDLQSLVQMANRMFAQGDAKSAETLYRTVLDSDPDHFDALYNLGVVYRDQHRLPEAQASFEAAIRSRPDHAEAHFALAVIYASQQQLEKAAAEIETVLRLDPQHAGAQAVLAGRTP
jgi:tetratricopeptide (TPR) repeat protein